MVNLEDEVINFIKKKAGASIFNKHKITLESDLDTDLCFDSNEVEEILQEYTVVFGVDMRNFDIKIYYPDDDISIFDALNPFKKRKRTVNEVPDLNIRMLVESAKAGRWLYA